MSRSTASTLVLTLSLLAACKGPPGEDGADGIDGEDGKIVLSIDSDTTWSDDTEIDGIWLVRDGVTLTIAQGVTVTVLPGAGLVVEGLLTTTGTGGEGVSFEALSRTSDSLGVQVLGTATELDGSTFTGLDLSLEGDGTAALSGAHFDDATLWVMDRSTPFSLTGATFLGSYTGSNPSLVAEVSAEVTLEDSSFDGGIRAVDFVGAGPGASLVVVNTTVSRADQGIFVTGLSDVHANVSLTDVVIEDIYGAGLGLSRADATLSGVDIARTNSSCITADAASSVSATDSTMVDSTASCIVANGSATLSQVEISGCGSLGVMIGAGGGTLTDVTIEDTYGSGVHSEGGDLQISDVVVRQSRNIGVYVDYGSIDSTNLLIEDTDGDGVLVSNGTADISQLTTRRTGKRGLILVNSESTVAGLDITDTPEQGLLAEGGTLTISDVTIADTGSYGLLIERSTTSMTDVSVARAQYGMYFQFTDLDAEGLSIDDTFLYGLYSYGGSTTVRDSSISNSQSTGVYGFQSDLDLTSVTISSAGMRGVQTSGSNATLTDCVVADSVERGLLVDGNVIATRTSVLRSGDTGIQSNELVMDHGEVAESGLRGVLLAVGAASSITDSDIRDNTDNGVQGPVAVDNVVDVSGTNLVGNGGYALYGVHAADGNYIASNRGRTDVDTTTDEAAEGEQTVTSSQVKYAQSITNPASEEIAGTGP